ncbi:hypothetical protein [Aegicerativicinus sediminis]|uniref:hypothetical protein n=1 Tax=Aegicerativicinus sediminis TaxID=2893202 RepID=UPI001E5150F0|nr:hypothetical protein [Aegicerativicinus sediminis]
MKHFRKLAILFFSSVIFFYACKDNRQISEIKEAEESSVSDTPSDAATSNANSAEAVQTAGGVFHYICNDGCAGGSASAGNCATCGKPLAHNQAYHSNTNNTPTAAPFATGANNNTAGVFHYTCPKGCAGGSGSAGNCAICGTTLAHNQAFHQ